MSTTTVTDNEQVNTVTSQPRSRKVSIQTDATSETGYDNLGYESSSKRKQSQVQFLFLNLLEECCL